MFFHSYERWNIFTMRRVWRYKRGNQNPEIYLRDYATHKTNAEIYLPWEEFEDTKGVIRILKYIYVTMQLTKRTQEYIYHDKSLKIPKG